MPEMEKDAMVARVPENLSTVRKLLEANRPDWRTYRRRNISEKKRVQLLKSIRSRKPPLLPVIA